jgi:hypothetical protein
VTVFPTFEKISHANCNCSDDAYCPFVNPLIPWPKNAGVFGITLTMGISPMISSMVLVDTPAAIEISSFSFVS